MEAEGNEAGGPSQRRLISSLAFAALFAALTAAGAFLIIPIGPLPIVLQNMFALLSGLVLGPLLGALSAAIFVAAGAVGAPVFAGGAAGLAVLLGPTGGYLFGYILGAFVAGAVAGSPKPGAKTPGWRIALAAAAGLLAVYLPGLARLSHFTGGLWQTLAAGFFPFVAGDAIKGVAAALAAPRLRRAAARLLSR